MHKIPQGLQFDQFVFTWLRSICLFSRDLMKCCQRIAVDLNGSQPLAKKKTILVNALDCFASCLPLADGRMAVARAICKNIDVPEYEVCIEFMNLPLASFCQQLKKFFWMDF